MDVGKLSAGIDVDATIRVTDHLYGSAAGLMLVGEPVKPKVLRWFMGKLLRKHGGDCDCSSWHINDAMKPMPSIGLTFN